MKFLLALIAAGWLTSCKHKSDDDSRGSDIVHCETSDKQPLAGCWSGGDATNLSKWNRIKEWPHNKDENWGLKGGKLNKPAKKRQGYFLAINAKADTIYLQRICSDGSQSAMRDKARFGMKSKHDLEVTNPTYGKLAKKGKCKLVVADTLLTKIHFYELKDKHAVLQLIEENTESSKTNPSFVSQNTPNPSASHPSSTRSEPSSDGSSGGASSKAPDPAPVNIAALTGTDEIGRASCRERV